MFVGKDFTPAVISKINQDSPAEKAGLMVNDQIIKIEGNKIKNKEALANPESLDFFKNLSQLKI